jgi:predicted alpha/beta hydrolase
MKQSGAGFRWVLLLAALLLSVCAATAYSVRWYHSFYHHVTHEELSHEIKHSTFEVTIRGGQPLTLQLYQQQNVAPQPLVLFTSGDGGWSPFCADVAAHLAATGSTVVGIDAKQYLVDFASPQKPIAIEQLTRDYDTIAQLSLVQPGVDHTAPVVLAGWSLGAGYSVIVASQPQFSLPVRRIVAISLPEEGELAWKSTDAVIYVTHGTPHEKLFDAHQYLRRLGQTPIVFLNATDDDTAPFNEAQSLYASASASKHLFAVKASGHHFEGGEKEFYHDLDQAVLDQSLFAPQMADKTDNKLKDRTIAAR